MRGCSQAVKADGSRRMGPHREGVAELSQGLGIHLISLDKEDRNSLGEQSKMGSLLSCPRPLQSLVGDFMECYWPNPMSVV